MHSFEVSLGYESVDRSTFSMKLPRFIENVLRSTLSYPNETSKECIQFLINTLFLAWFVCPQLSDRLHTFIDIVLDVRLNSSNKGTQR